MASALDWPTPVRVSAMAVASAVLMLTLSAANALAVSTSDSTTDLARMAIDFMGFLLLCCSRHAADGVDRLPKRAGRRYHPLSYSHVSLQPNFLSELSCQQSPAKIRQDVMRLLHTRG